jgi:hypothetical protein
MLLVYKITFIIHPKRETVKGWDGEMFAGIFVVRGCLDRYEKRRVWVRRICAAPFA